MGSFVDCVRKQVVRAGMTDYTYSLAYVCGRMPSSGWLLKQGGIILGSGSFGTPVVACDVSHRAFS